MPSENFMSAITIQRPTRERNQADHRPFVDICIENESEKTGNLLGITNQLSI